MIGFEGHSDHSLAHLTTTQDIKHLLDIILITLTFGFSASSILIQTVFFLFFLLPVSRFLVTFLFPDNSFKKH